MVERFKKLFLITIIRILENFMRRKTVVCYGGTAINNILPVTDQFYDKDVEIPDYDFFSPMALKHATELADIYANNNYESVEVRSGVHKETYKVFVNFDYSVVKFCRVFVCKVLWSCV